MNGTNDLVQGDRDSIPLFFQKLTAVLGILICATSIITIVVLFRCRKIVEQIRITSIQLCVANFGYGLTLVVNVAIIFINGKPNAAILKLVPCFCVLYFLFLTFTGIDRLMTLTFATKYTLWSRKRNIYMATVGIYAVATCICIVIFQQETRSECLRQKDKMSSCIGVITFVATMIFLTTCHFVSFICISCIVVKKDLPGPLTKRNDFSKYWRITIKMIKLGFMSFVFVTPYIVTRLQFILNLWKEVETNTIFARYVAVSLLHMHQILSPVFILFSYHECRFVALHAILCCCKSWRKKTYDQYKQYYASYKISSVRMEPLPRE